MFYILSKARLTILLTLLGIAILFGVIVINTPNINQTIPLLGVFLVAMFSSYGVFHGLKYQSIPDSIGVISASITGFICFLAILVNGTTATTAVPFVLTISIIISTRVCFTIISATLLITSIFNTALTAKNLELGFALRAIMSSFSVAFIGQLFYVLSSEYMKEQQQTQKKLEEVIRQRTTGLKNALAEVAQKNAFLKSIIDNAVDAIIVIDSKGNICEFSRAAQQIFGYKKEEVLNRNVKLLMPSAQAEKHDKYLARYAKEKKSKILGRTRNEYAKHKNGIIFPIEIRVTEMSFKTDKYFFGSIRDITARKEAEKEAITDKLTQLYNRKYLDMVLSRSIHNCQHHGHKLSIIILDIDNFKSVNDIYGHQTGDIVLQETVSVLRKNIRLTDTFGRWGGEEFVIILPEVDLNNAHQLADNLRKAILTSNFTAIGKLTCSFGVSSFFKGDTEASILERADQALYLAKRKGKNRVELENYKTDNY